jgi:hypothetical protein
MHSYVQHQKEVNGHVQVVVNPTAGIEDVGGAEKNSYHFYK